VLAASAAILIGNMTAFEYMYNGKVLGIVKDQRDVYMTVEVIGDKLTHVYGAEINIDPVKDIAFRKVIGWNLPIDDKDKVLNTLTYLRDMNAKAYALLIDGKKVAILDSVTDAESILNTVKSKYTSDSESIQYTSIGFAENVKIEEVSTKIGNIDNEEAALEFILTGAVEKKIHKVASGETFNVIANHYGLTPAELQEANRGTSPDRLQIGQELVLNQIVPLVTVQTTEVAKYMTAIQYDITFEETSTLYKGEQTIKSSGKSGQKEVVAEIVRENGTEVKREELSAVVVSAPVSQVVLKGTKELPPLIGTGTFIYPTRGTLSSRFGTRWGRMHYGIDIAAPYGTKIRASDGGKVIFAGWDGALGYVVRIDHGQNKVTVYGHCSKLMVKAGDKVYQDQHIANVGSTGRSTGPHVHFEVRINGVAKNPLNYLK
jgi:murein DD-endopeptidase MepM/ murein hydrolase activator NlpD